MRNTGKLIAFPEFGCFMMVKEGPLPAEVPIEFEDIWLDGTLLTCAMFNDNTPDIENIGEFEIICGHVVNAANKTFGTTFVCEDFNQMGVESHASDPCECREEARALHSDGVGN
jgi:hypothetical protein